MSFFDKNRQALQEAFYTSTFLKQLTTSIHEIIEDKNLHKPDTLKKITLTDIPLPAWRVKLELEGGMFELPGKKPEEALFFYTKEYFVILLIEMKSKLGYKEVGGLEEKFKFALEKLLSLLPIYLHGEVYKQLKPLYIGLTVFKEDKATRELNRDVTNKKNIHSIFLEAMKQANPLLPLQKGIDTKNLGYHKPFHYAFHQEDTENAHYSLKHLLKVLNINTNEMYPCPNQQKKE